MHVMSITPSRGGSVGIGTLFPVAKLDVYSNDSTGSSDNVALTIRADSTSYGSVTNGFGSRIQFQTNRGYEADQTLASADIKGYIYSGAGSTTDYHALDLNVYGDNVSLNKGISIFAKSSTGGAAETVVHGKLGVGTTDPSYNLDVWSTQDSVWNARIYNYTTGSDDDCKMVVQAASTGGEVHYTLMTPNILWHMVTGSGSGEALQFSYDDNPGSSPNYNTGTLAGYITKKSDNASLNFTGQHRTFIKDIPFSEASSLEGLIVSANTDEYIKMSGGIEYGNNAITINESLPLVNLSSIQNDKACFGVISLSEDPDTREDKYGTYVAVIKKKKEIQEYTLIPWVKELCG
jgi:hypothetical protein